MGLLALGGVLLACGGDIESRMGEIRALQAVGQFQESVDELQDVLERDPNLPEANYRLGLALVQTGEPSRAVWPLQKAAESSDYEISAGVLLASTHFQTRNFDEAIRAADHVLRIDPKRQAALRIRASANLAARRLDEALADTTRLVGLFPDDYGVRALHATVLGDLGRIDEAKREHDLLKEMGDRSDDPDFRNRACLAPAIFANDTLGDTERATALYEDCASRKPTDVVVINHLVNFFDAQGDVARGTSLWREAVAEAPEKLGLRQGLAARLQALGEADEAEGVLRDAVELFGSASAWNLLASFYRNRGEPEKALEAIEKVVALSGDDGDERARFILADVLIDLGDLDRAREVTDGLSQVTYAELLRGRIHLVSGDPEAALRDFERGIRAWPGNASARFLAGIAARNMGDTDRAISELREAVRANNAETDAAVELARLYLETAQYQQAITFANLALSGRGGVEQPDPYVIAARALTSIGQIARARRSIDALRERGFEQVAVREQLVLDRTALGAAQALEAVDASGLDLADPDHFGLLREVIDTEIAAGRTASALVRLDRALAREPASLRLLELRGGVLAAGGRSEAARTAFEQILAEHPDNAAALAGLATLAAEAGDTAGAIEGFDRAYALAPYEGGYGYAAAQLVLASGDTDAAVTRLRHLVRHHPGLVGARNDLAWILADAGQELDLALTLARQARRHGAAASILDTLGWVHFQRGEYAEAAQVLEAAVANAPEAPSMRYRLGLALQRKGEKDRAREMFEAALAAGAFPEAEEARHQLALLAGS